MLCVSVITCSSVPSRRNMTVSCPQGRGYGASCTFACQTGYRLIGPDKVTCERGDGTSPSGVWRSDQPHCDGELTSAGPKTLLFKCRHITHLVKVSRNRLIDVHYVLYLLNKMLIYLYQLYLELVYCVERLVL